jgi:hypothetical protein
MTIDESASNATARTELHRAGAREEFVSVGFAQAPKK